MSLRTLVTKLFKAVSLQAPSPVLVALLTVAVIVPQATSLYESIRISRLESNVRAATFLLAAKWGNKLNEEPITHGLCTATVYEKTGPKTYRLITAGHCLVVPESDGAHYFVKHDTLTGQSEYPVKVIKRERQDPVDFMVLELTTDEKLPVVPLGNELDSKMNDPLYVVNFSEMLIKQESHGVIASNIMDEAAIDPNYADCSICQKRFIAHLFAGPGASGSLVIDERTGKAIGILTGGTSLTIGAFIEPISDFQPWYTGRPVLPSRWDRFKAFIGSRLAHLVRAK